MAVTYLITLRWVTNMKWQMDVKGFHLKTNKLKRLSSNHQYLIIISEHFLLINRYHYQIITSNISRILANHRWEKYRIFYWLLIVVGMSLTTVSCVIDFFFSCLEKQYPIPKLVTNSSSLSKVRYNESIWLTESYQH